MCVYISAYTYIDTHNGIVLHHKMRLKYGYMLHQRKTKGYSKTRDEDSKCHSVGMNVYIDANRE